MMGRVENSRHNRQLVSTEQLVPQDHFLRYVDAYIDFSFIEDILTPYYPPASGRKSIPPITMFKMLFISYWYGIRSERQLEKEIHTNIAYRWFLGMDFETRVPDHSTISYNRKHRFQNTTIIEEIFNAIVQQAIDHNMVGGRVLYTDSTHVKANANKNKFVRTVKPEKAVAHLDVLEEAANQDRIAHGKKH